MRNYPGGVREWCVNTGAFDPATRSMLINNEDGYLYRWDLATNQLSQRIRFNNGLGQSYTPTAVGPDGTIYSINNAVLFAVGHIGLLSRDVKHLVCGLLQHRSDSC